jgi:hypothetical protein
MARLERLPSVRDVTEHSMTPEDGERGLPKASSIAICSGSPGLSFAADSALQQSWLKADLLVDKPIRAEVLRNDVNGLLNRAAS